MNLNTSNNVWRKAVLPIDATVHQVILNLDSVPVKLVLILDKKHKLIGTISDGDVRRGLLGGLDLNSTIDSIINRSPFVAPAEWSRTTVMQLMLVNKIRQIPIVDANQQVVGVHLWDQIVTPVKLSNPMVIMAGGKGTRLMPYTKERPKPMVNVGGKPILEHIIERAKQEGFNHFIIAIHHLGEMIEDYFGDGARLGVKVEYLREHIPLGTVGALSLFSPKPTVPFIVTNGDVLTDIRYGELLDFHIRQNANATMAVRLHEWEHPFGVVHMEGIDIVGFEEKPVAQTHINAGVYVLSPCVLDSLGTNLPCDMPALFEQLHLKKSRTVAYPMHEPWLDIGRPNDLEAAHVMSKDKLS